MPNSPVQLVAVESQLAKMLYWDLGDEGAETEWWRRLCSQAGGVLEMGANIGYYTVEGAMASSGVPYVAVEANPESTRVIRRNLALNGVENVTVVEAAVIDDGGRSHVDLAIPTLDSYVAPTGAFVTDAEVAAWRSSSRSVRVPTISVGELLDDVDLVKLDIEGYETRVLRSAMEWIRKSRPTIVVEVLNRAEGTRQVVREIHADGYMVLAIGVDSLHVIPGEIVNGEGALPRFGSRDVILVPGERAHLL